MKIRPSAAVTAVVLACLAIPSAATPAAAAGPTVQCATLGVSSYLSATRESLDTLRPLDLWVRDTEADGHHVAVRLISQESDGDIVTWRWHHYYGGSGDGTEWRTYASSSEGIRRVKVQAAVFEGDTQIRQCQSGWDA